ncbi:MAG: glutaredoxin 3 [Candidatus Wallbacteria bacterium]|nr:glutaredoxin 3 [Candidatus Wallbacteria bacterium]
MKTVVIYTKSYCPYCHNAVALLRKKGATYEEIDVTSDSTREAEMQRKSGRDTVPQIWIGTHHVGGCDDLMALDARGELDRMLAG